MVDLGIVQIPLEAINFMVILTALLLAAKYIGFDIIASIFGIIAVVYGLRVALDDYLLSVSGYMFGMYEGWLLAIVGGFLVFRGTSSFFGSNEVNTWK